MMNSHAPAAAAAAATAAASVTSPLLPANFDFGDSPLVGQQAALLHPRALGTGGGGGGEQQPRGFFSTSPSTAHLSPLTSLSSLIPYSQLPAFPAAQHAATAPVQSPGAFAAAPGGATNERVKKVTMSALSKLQTADRTTRAMAESSDDKVFAPVNLSLPATALSNGAQQQLSEDGTDAQYSGGEKPRPWGGEFMSPDFSQSMLWPQGTLSSPDAGHQAWFPAPHFPNAASFGFNPHAPALFNQQHLFAAGNNNSSNSGAAHKPTYSMYGNNGPGASHPPAAHPPPMRPLAAASSSSRKARPRAKAPRAAAKPLSPDEPRITSKHRGVCWYRRTKKWVVQTKVNKKRVHIGYFSDEEEAARAYQLAVANIHQKGGDVVKNIRDLIKQSKAPRMDHPAAAAAGAADVDAGAAAGAGARPESASADNGNPDPDDGKDDDDDEEDDDEQA